MQENPRAQPCQKPDQRLTKPSSTQEAFELDRKRSK
ncbi:hypothetical protein TNIN_161741, partial [Trichonephila inaurata madagascariensis]